MNTTPQQRAEQHGHAETAAVLNAIRGAKTQAERITLLHALVVDLAKTEHFESTLAGFSAAILAPLERGLGVG